MKSAQLWSSLASSTMLIEQASSPMMSNFLPLLNNLVPSRPFLKLAGVRYLLLTRRSLPFLVLKRSSSNSNSTPCPHATTQKRSAIGSPVAGSMDAQSTNLVRFIGSAIPRRRIFGSFLDLFGSVSGSVRINQIDCTRLLSRDESLSSLLSRENEIGVPVALRFCRLVLRPRLTSRREFQLFQGFDREVGQDIIGRDINQNRPVQLALPYGSSLLEIVYDLARG